MAIHSSVLAWRIPGTGEPGGLPSLGLHTAVHNWSDLTAAAVSVGTGLTILLWCVLSCFSRVWLSDAIDCSLPDSSVHGILQARILEWAARPSSRRSSGCRDLSTSVTSPALAGGFFTTRVTWEAPSLVKLSYVLCIFATFCLSVHNGERTKVSSVCSSGSHVLLKALPIYLLLSSPYANFCC